MAMTIGQPGMTPGVQPPPVDKKPPEQMQQEKKSDFQDHLQQHNAQQANAAQSLQGVNPTQQVQQAGQVQKLDPATHLESTQRTNATGKPEAMDMFGRMDALKGEFQAFINKSAELDAQISSGKLKMDDPKVMSMRREEMRTMLHLQSEMQSSAMKVEIASKVVEHSTSGVKTVLQTQA